MRCASWIVPIALCAPALVAQELPIRTWNVQDGLAQSRVNAIRRDSAGYAWFATWEGLSRYDGRRFVNYGAREGLPNPLVWCVVEAPDGRMWLGTHGGGLARVPRVGTALEVDPIGPCNPARRVFRIAFDADGRAWIVTDRGLFVAEAGAPERSEFRHVDELGDAWFGLPFTHTDGSLWFVAADQLVRCRGDGVERWDVPRDPGGGDANLGELRAACVRRAGGLWVTYVRSLQVIDLPTADGRGPVRHARPLDLGASTSLYDVAEDAAGRTWIATSGGLVRVEGSAIRWLTVDQGLPDSWVHALACEPGVGLWIGTHQGGAAFLADSGVERASVRSGLGDGHAVKLIADDSGNWLVSTEVAGLYELADGRAHRIPGTDRPPFDRIQRSIARDAAGTWWVGTTAGLFQAGTGRLDLSSSTVAGDAGGVPAGESYVCGLDPAGGVLVATGDGRVRVGEPGQPRFRTLPFALPKGIARAVATAADGALWLTEGQRLWRARGDRLEEIDPWPDSAEDPLPRVLLSDSRGWLWVGTRFGGAAFTRDPGSEHPAFERITTRDGLASDAVFALAEDRPGAVYMGTGRGVHRRHPLEGTWEPIGMDDPTGGTWINDIAFDADGDPWIAGVNGVTHIHRSGVTRSSPPPAVRFTRCSVAGADLELPTAGAFEIPPITVGVDDSRLAFEFVAVEPLRGQGLHYATRLTGLDAEWSTPGPDVSARYGRLAAGDYRFEVRSFDPRTGLASGISGVRVEVVPPVWARPWFLSVAILVASGLLLALHRLRLRRELALERVRTQIASDLHDDIGAGLAQIAIASELARGAPPGEARDVLAEVAEEARSLRSSMSDLVWAVDPRNDSLADVVRRMRHFAGEMGAGAGLVVEFRAPAEDDLLRLPAAPDLRRNLFLFFKESVANAARHARATRLAVELALDGGRLRVVIEDDGRGFDAAARHAGQGLRNLRRRAADLGADLSIESTTGRGTRITLDLPLQGRRPHVRAVDGDRRDRVI